MLSKIERSERNAKHSQVPIPAKILKISQNELLTLWLVDKVYEIVNLAAKH